MNISDQIYFYGLSGLYIAFLIIFGISLVFALVTQVPFVPTRKKVIKKLLGVSNLKSAKTIMDLGCGDGRLLFEAEKKASKAKLIGFEISPLPYLWAKLNRLVKRSKAEIRFESLFKADLAQADLIFVYLIPDILPRLKEKLTKECKKGTQIISHTFKIPGITPKETLEKTKSLPVIYIYEI